MRHVLTFLCTAFLPFLTIDEVAASLLLNNNPTPPSIELDPAFVSGEGYQIAKVTWLPDYLGNNKSHGGGRVSTSGGGEGGGSKACANYGFFDECPTGQIGTKVSPVAGLSCYKNCKAVDCKEYGLVSKADCPLHWTVLGESKKIGGVSCYEFCACDTVSYYKYTEYNCRRIGKKAGGEKCNFGLECDYQGHCELDSVGDNWHYTECVCPEEYSLSSCPANANCTQCDSKYKFVDCQEGYTASGNTCVKKENCSAYPLTVCPTGGTCSKCPDNSTKLKLDSCDASKGWSLSGNSCVATASCPAGYTAGVTSCDSNSTKPHYSQNGWSGGQQCGVCKCNNTCSTEYFNLTEKPEHASFVTCTSGCGSEAKTLYHLNYCESGYELKNGKCELPGKTCESGGYKSSVSAGEVCTKVAYEGLTCYKDCLTSSICAGNYVDSDDIMYTSDNAAVGFKYSSKYYLLDVDGLTWGMTSGQFQYCRNRNGEVPSSSSMTSIIKKALNKFPDSNNKTILQGDAPWWTAGSGGTWIKDGKTVSGGSCGTCGYCYSNSNGACYAFEAEPYCGKNKYCTLSPLPRTLCVQDCSGLAPLKSCPSNSYKEGSCPQGKVEADHLFTLEDGTVCYSCKFATCPSGTYSVCPSGWTKGSLASTLSDGTKCYKCTKPSSGSCTAASHPECKAAGYCGYVKCRRPDDWQAAAQENDKGAQYHECHGKLSDGYWCCLSCADGWLVRY